IETYDPALEVTRSLGRIHQSGRTLIWLGALLVVFVAFIGLFLVYQDRRNENRIRRAQLNRLFDALIAQKVMLEEDLKGIKEPKFVNGVLEWVQQPPRNPGAILLCVSRKWTFLRSRLNNHERRLYHEPQRYSASLFPARKSCCPQTPSAGKRSRLPA